ncbi:DUF309 domain-containing protein [Arcobacter sp. LA11]|uniref:DUF309 domain-containing protein n=1 Tax=Arcobacter sp. LA11 TaxID=1898176 RepID=UPI0009323F45|nr:DUF309 domain-containing protein [Arcobacter sp. LA11]
MYDKTIFTQSSAIKRFIYALENRLFVEAHELLEDDWKNYKKNGEKEKAKALQGLINGATALALYYIKNRPEGYKKVWPVFEKYKHLLNLIEIEEKEKFYEAKDLLIKINNNIKL